jgi:hypothetical protein
MRFRLLYFEQCANWKLAEARLREAVAAISSWQTTTSEGRGETIEIDLELVESAAKAERLRFRGSPTILLDGEDLFSPTEPPGFTCRLYRTEAGVEGAPSTAQLLHAIRQRLAAD